MALAQDICRVDAQCAGGQGLRALPYKSPKHPRDPSLLGHLQDGCPTGAHQAVVQNALCSVAGFPYLQRALRQSFIKPSLPQRPTPQTAEKRLQNLVGALATCSAATCDETRKKRDATYNLFIDYLNGMNAEPATASDAHCIAFLDAYSHRGTFLVNGQPRSSPESMHNQIGYLRKAIELYDGRVGPFCPISLQGMHAAQACKPRSPYALWT